MGKSYNRRFRKNGLSFIVQDTHPADRKSDTDKYYLTVNKDGIYKIVYDNITWEIPKFQLYTQPSSGRLPVLILSAQCRVV